MREDTESHANIRTYNSLRRILGLGTERRELYTGALSKQLALDDQSGRRLVPSVASGVAMRLTIWW
jgi:hypothetical protein